jgi:hypothetical protein
MREDDPQQPFSLTGGGPFYRLLRALRLVPDLDRGLVRLMLLAVVVTWMPLLAMSLFALGARGSVPVLFGDWSVHVRLLLAVPLLLQAERSLHRRSQRCLDRFAREQWAADAGEALGRLTGAAARWRDAAAPELLMLLLAVVGSQAVVHGVGEGAGIVRGRDPGPHELPVTLWYGLVSLPIYQFLVYRWLWRWIVWARLLFGLSRLRLRPLPNHPDRRGGLAFLAEPAIGFGYILLAFSSVQSGIWANRVLYTGAVPAAFKPQLALLIVISLGIALAPLLAFVPALWRGRFAGIRQYDELAADLGRSFHERYVVRREREGLLGSGDVSSLADMGTSYQVVEGMRLVPFAVRDIVILLAAVVAPMLPLVLLRMPFDQLVKRLGEVVLGGGLHGG